MMKRKLRLIKGGQKVVEANFDYLDSKIASAEKPSTFGAISEILQGMIHEVVDPLKMRIFEAAGWYNEEYFRHNLRKRNLRTLAKALPEVERAEGKVISEVVEQMIAEKMVRELIHHFRVVPAYQKNDVIIAALNDWYHIDRSDLIYRAKILDVIRHTRGLDESVAMSMILTGLTNDLSAVLGNFLDHSLSNHVKNQLLHAGFRQEVKQQARKFTP